MTRTSLSKIFPGLALIVFIFASGCGDHSFTVSSTSPSNGATDVAVNTSVSATFSDQVKADTVSTSTFTLKDSNGNIVGGTVSASGSTATFMPSANLAYSTTYTAEITSSVSDWAGRALGGTHTWTFTTGSLVDITPPSVSSTSPLGGATGVAVNASLSATFSEALNPAFVNSATFTLTDSGGNPVAGTISYSGVTATFAPLGNLAFSTTFTARIINGVVDMAGNALASDYTWIFTTGLSSDTAPPLVTFTDPPNYSTGVSVTRPVYAIFSEALDPAFVNSATFTLTDSGGNPVTGAVGLSGLRATFTPSGSLSYMTAFTARISNAVRDLAANQMTEDYTWTFTTASNWSATSTSGAPAGRVAHTAIWTGSEMIVWGGWSGTSALNTGARYNPATDSWTPISTAGAPSARDTHTAVWTGSEMIVWGGVDDFGSVVGDGAKYSPATDSWSPISSSGAPSARKNHTTVWTGSEMIVWGGQDDTLAYLNNGGRYDPAADSWSPISPSGAPAERVYHTAVWTGSEMIVWGGVDSGLNALDTGGKYDPAGDSWTSTTSSGAPIARDGHTAVWTGTEMIIWGGEDNGLTYLNSGGRYDPSADSWSNTSTSGAPVARLNHTSVWTGSSMMVWGGKDNSLNSLQTGGVYSPSSDSWSQTTVSGAPTARINPTLVWSGSQAIMWGGQEGSSYANTGGRYVP